MWRDFRKRPMIVVMPTNNPLASPEEQARAAILIGLPGEAARIRVTLGELALSTHVFFDGVELRGCYAAVMSALAGEATTLSFGFIRSMTSDINTDAISYLKACGAEVEVIDLTNPAKKGELGRKAAHLARLSGKPVASQEPIDTEGELSIDDIAQRRPRVQRTTRTILEANAARHCDEGVRLFCEFVLLVEDGWSEAEARAQVWPVNGVDVTARPKLRKDGFPSRNDMSMWSKGEHAIQGAVDSVETMGAHPLLTEAVVLLGEARAKVADFVELPQAPVDPTLSGTPFENDDKLPVARLADVGPRVLDAKDALMQALREHPDLVGLDFDKLRVERLAITDASVRYAWSIEERVGGTVRLTGHDIMTAAGAEVVHTILVQRFVVTLRPYADKTDPDILPVDTDERA